MLTEINDYDWREVFAASGDPEGENNTLNISRAVPGDPITPLTPFSREDVQEILHISEGENDGQSWIIVVHLSDNRFAFLEGSCDYTGWGCRSGCSCQVAGSYEDIIRYGCGEEARERFGIPVDGEEKRRIRF